MTLQNYAQWCSNIYNDIYPANLLEGYANNGFDSWIIDSASEIVIVIRGTDDIHDILQDISMVAGILPSHTKYADEIFSSALIHANKLQKPIVATGHSLGGSLCQYLTYKNAIHSYNFNPYGILDCIRCTQIAEQRINLCMNYCITDDVVSGSSMQYQFGKVIMWDIPNADEVMRNMSLPQMILYRHSIDTCIKLIKEM